MAALARSFPQARIVYSGGDASLLGNQPDEAQFALPLLESFGVARARIALERRSRNTYQNAAFSKELVKPKPGERWLLVTSAHHMPRAVGCFRRVGFDVEAYPVDWRTRGLAGSAAAVPIGFGGPARAPTRRCANGSASWPIGSPAAPRNCFPVRTGLWPISDGPQRPWLDRPLAGPGRILT